LASFYNYSLFYWFLNCVYHIWYQLLIDPNTIYISICLPISSIEPSLYIAYYWSNQSSHSISYYHIPISSITSISLSLTTTISMSKYNLTSINHISTIWDYPPTTTWSTIPEYYYPPIYPLLCLSIHNWSISDSYCPYHYLMTDNTFYNQYLSISPSIIDYY